VPAREFFAKNFQKNIFVLPSPTANNIPAHFDTSRKFLKN
jgi:hypothetical protein